MPKILEELRTIGTVDLACKATNILEKALWIAILMTGTLWAVYFISLSLKELQKNQTIVSKGSVKLNELNYPAITVCSEVSPKYAIAEQLGNYYDTEKELPKELNDILTKLAKWIAEAQDTFTAKVQTISTYKRKYKYKCDTARTPYCKVSLIKIIYELYTVYTIVS